MSSVALHGNLRDFGIAEVFQLIGQQRKTGTLEVSGGDGPIFLAFDEGRVVRGGPAGGQNEFDGLGDQLVRSGYLTRDDVESMLLESERSARPLLDILVGSGRIDAETLAGVQHLLTREVLFDVMRRSSGDFHFTAEPITHDTPPEDLLGAEQILMDGLRMLDEWRTFVDVVPSSDAVFCRVGDLEAARALTKGESDVRMGHAERVLQLVDGRLSARRVVDLSRLGTFEATRTLAELRQAGVIELVTSRPSKPRMGQAGRRRLPVMKLLRVALGTTLPFVLLAVIAVQMAGRMGPTAGLPGSAIPTSPVERLSASYEARLIRGLIQAHYFETGRHPVDLKEISVYAEQADASLTPERLGAYYYVVRDEEVVLLAPPN
jgi:hypothetical protein